MSKNLTRKGIAFGALVALGTSLIAGAPAQAIESNVSLAPTTGTEYTVLKGQSFSLDANFSNAAKQTGTFLKFLVADPSEKITSVTGQFSVATGISSTANSNADIAVAGQVVTVLVGSQDNVDINDFVTVTAATALTGGAGLVGTYPVTAVDYALNTISYTVPAGTTVADASAGTLNVVLATTANRSATKSFVIDTKSDVNTSAKTMTLTAGAADATTQTATVTAWVDTNDNGLIDTATEYSSPAQTVKFINPAELTVTTSLTPVSVGTENLEASITTVPALNGQQVGTGNVGAVFTRQDSTSEVAAIARSWNDTTKTWAAQVSLSTSAVATENTDSNNLYGTATTAAWTGLTRPPGRNVTHASSKVASKVLTITAASAHSLRVGDKVTVTGATETAVNAVHTVTSIPSATTFTAALDTADLAALTTSGTVAYTVTTYSGNTGIVDRGFAGNYSAIAAFKAFGDVISPSAAAADNQAQKLVKAGVSSSGTAKAKTASAIDPEVLVSANTVKIDATNSQVRKGTTEATVIVSITNADGAAVGAGVNAVATVSGISGTFKVAGVTVANAATSSALTDANGQARFVVSNAAAAVDNAITLTVASEGVTGVAETLTWKDSIYRIVDLADQSVNGSARNRAVADKAAYTFNLQVQDQFRVVAPATLRLLVTATGNTVSTQTVDLVAGKATYSVADGGLTTGDTTVAVEFQKLTGTTWATVAGGASDEYIDWNGADAPDLAAVLIKYYDQTDVLTLNANAATTPSGTAADFAASTAKNTLVALDGRSSSVIPTTVVGSDAAVVSGAVTNSVTGAAKAGQVISLSGAGLMFKSGDVWSLGSATTIANDGTFSVEVYSNNPGTKVVTVAVGSVTKTASLVFTGASSAVRKLTISGEQFPTAGSTLRAEILLVDGNGNGVDTVAPATTPVSEYISVSYDGPGLLSGAALPAETDKDGKASVRYLLGVGDRGAATVTVKFDANFDGDFVDATDITVTRVYNIGGSAASEARVAGSTNRFFVTVDTNSLARNVVVKVAGRTFATLKGANAKKTYIVRAPKGSHKVTVYVGGKLLVSKTIVVK